MVKFQDGNAFPRLKFLYPKLVSSIMVKVML